MKKERKLAWGIVLFCIGAAILLLTFYYWWQYSYQASANQYAGQLLAGDLYYSLARYFGYILGGTLIISALYIILACL
ncbi:MAG TPA: hypothetical protein VJL27_01950 [Patescibacteria group bacterium]|nr:hypothetical protein [Patescibacteria group bacterium]